MYKGYKVRLFPTPEQEELLWKHIHACRFVWNYMLNYHEKYYEEKHENLSKYSMFNLLKPLKNDGDHDWLYQVSHASLQRICADLDSAYRKFFKKTAKHPRYKTKKSKSFSYPVRDELGTVYFDNETVMIPTIKHIKYKTNYNLPKGKTTRIYNPRISFIDNKWIFSFALKFENQEQELNNFSMGIDLGIKELAVVSVNNQKIVYHNINKSKQIQDLNKKLIHIQRVLDRKYRANNYRKTNNILKYEKIQKRIYKRISNIRRNYIHTTTRYLVNIKPRRVIMEDLNIYDMVKNKYLSKDIYDQAWGEFIYQMKYKCEWAGIEFIQADRWYPSSKTCSRCGEIKKDLKLSDRVYKCPCCGLEIDRDYNAAINLMKYESQTERLSA